MCCRVMECAVELWDVQQGVRGYAVGCEGCALGCEGCAVGCVRI